MHPEQMDWRTFRPWTARNLGDGATRALPGSSPSPVTTPDTVALAGGTTRAPIGPILSPAATPDAAQSTASVAVAAGFAGRTAEGAAGGGCCAGDSGRSDRAPVTDGSAASCAQEEVPRDSGGASEAGEADTAEAALESPTQRIRAESRAVATGLRANPTPDRAATPARTLGALTDSPALEAVRAVGAPENPAQGIRSDAHPTLDRRAAPASTLEALTGSPALEALLADLAARRKSRSQLDTVPPVALAYT